MTGKRILMIVGDFGEDYETMVPFQALLAVGHTSTPSAPTRRRATRSRRRSTISKASRPIRRSAATISRSTRASPTSIRRATTRLVIPGGRAPEYLRLNARVIEIVRHFFAAEQAGRRDLPRRADPRRGGRAQGADLLGLSGLPAGSRTRRRNLRRHRDRRRRDRRQSRQRPRLAGPSGVAVAVLRRARHVDQPRRRATGGVTARSRRRGALA